MRRQLARAEACESGPPSELFRVADGGQAIRFAVTVRDDLHDPRSEGQYRCTRDQALNRHKSPFTELAGDLDLCVGRCDVDEMARKRVI